MTACVPGSTVLDVRWLLRGSVIEATARWTDAVRPDTVFMPFHWSGIGSVNQVTTDATDPISGMPEFKVCAVGVQRWDGPVEVLDDESLLFAEEVVA